MFFHNISNGHNKKFSFENCKYENNKTDIYTYLAFKNKYYNMLNKPSHKKILFNITKKLTIKFKCINWFEYQYSNYLAFLILKARSIDDNKTHYFFFRKYDYLIYKKSDIESNPYLSTLYELSKNKSKLYDIYNITFENYIEKSVKHYDVYNRFLEFCNNRKNINDVNKIKYSDFVILKTNFPQKEENSSCENKFKPFRFFMALNNISPSGAFELNNFNVSASKIFNNYFIEDHDIKDLFSNKIELSNDVPRHLISFDIESEVVKHREINNEKNIVTHCGIEYYNTLNDNYQEYQNHLNNKNILNNSFNFCLINFDFYLRQELENKNPSLYNDLKNYLKPEYLKKLKFIKDDYSEDDLVYDYFRNKIYNNNKQILYFVNNELNILKNKENCIVIYNQYNTSINLTNLLEIIITKKIKYVLIDERNIISTLFNSFNTLDVDSILTFNGSSYDFPQLGRKLTYLTGTTIKSVCLLPSIMSSKTLIEYVHSENNKIGSSIQNIKGNTQYYFLDIYSYLKKWFPDFDTFSLKERSKHVYNLDSIIIYDELYDQQNLIETNVNRYKIYLLDNTDNQKMINFIKVLFTSNYCFIDNKAYKIINKSNIIENDRNMYEINIDNIINKKTTTNDGTIYLLNYFEIESIKTNKGPQSIFKNNNFKWNEYKNFIKKIYLSKDDVDISAFDIFKKESMFDIADYCIHDSILCRHLYKYYMLKDNIDIFSHVYVLPQSLSLVYRNSTNFQGYFLISCLRDKSFLIKSKKVLSGKYSGGNVIEPREKFIKDPVIMLDFESLYPSIIMQFNISPDKLISVLDLSCQIEFALAKENIEYTYDKNKYTVIYDEKPLENKYLILIFSKIDYYGNKSDGIIISLLNDLKNKRRYFKSLKKNYELGINECEKNDYKSKNCDLIQLSYKILMNSIYGFIGSEFSLLSCTYTSQAVTLIGYQAIEFLTKYLDGSIINHNMLEITSGIKYNPIIHKPIETNIFKFNYGLDHPIMLKIIYGDTDSVMFAVKNINKLDTIINQPDEIYKKRIIVLCSFLGRELTNWLNNVILENYLKLENEYIYVNMILIAKKKYKTEKCEPITNFPENCKDLSILNIDQMIKDNRINIKHDNKGISLIRRDNCYFQKQKMEEFYNILQNKIIEKRFIDSSFKDQDLIILIEKFVLKIKENLLIQYINNTLNPNEFTISCSFKDNYKNDNFYMKALVENYNKTGKEKILQGDRFEYLFIRQVKNKDLIKEFINNQNKNIKDLLNIMDWSYINKDINSYKKIVSDINSLNHDSNDRLAFEIYLRNIINDIKTIFSNKDTKNKSQINNDVLGKQIDLIHKKI